MKTVSTLEVKRSFVIADLIKAPPNRKRYLELLSKKDFKKKLVSVKKRVLRMNEAQLDARISPHWSRRLRSYNSANWRITTFKTSELGVWKRAGNLPLKWTQGTLAQTAKEVKKGLEQNSPLITGRAKRAIPRILSSVVNDLQKEKYLFPVAFKAGTGTNGRRGLKTKVTADLDDGCMRSIALAVAGKKSIRLYFGTPKLKKPQ